MHTMGYSTVDTRTDKAQEDAAQCTPRGGYSTVRTSWIHTVLAKDLQKKSIQWWGYSTVHTKGECSTVHTSWIHPV